MTASAPQPKKPNLRRDVTVAGICGVVAAMMVGAAYASVPLYSWFCRTTGFGGTTQVAVAAPGKVLGRMITVRFDSNVAPGLPWKFEPEQNEIKIHIGEVATVHYKVTNMAAREITAQAGYNVAPPTVGAYFTKINCFCFTQQTMKPAETREMTVVFYVDPSLVKDSDQDRLDTITLSYTFYRIPNPEKPVAEAPAAPDSKKL
jgi:cytochrome c oxidase assembly protein subunit 11